MTEAVPEGRTRIQSARVREIFATLLALPEGDPERQRLRAQLVEMHLPLVEYLARRFRNRGEPHDDLVQVGTIGLIKSVDRFDTDRGVEFATYATPTIVGELKRYFRDRSGAIRLPRRLQEHRLAVNRGREELTQLLGRSPTIRDLADHLDLTEEQVIEAIEAGQTARPLSLDSPVGSGEDDLTLADTVGADDPEYGHVDYHESLHGLLARLPEREQKIISLRFYGNLTQVEIAEKVGLSQMHVSRLLRQSLDFLRRALQQTD